MHLKSQLMAHGTMPNLLLFSGLPTIVSDLPRREKKIN
jgi:hypothetical protein